MSPEKAEKIAKAIGVPPELLVRLSIEADLQAAGLRYEVEIKPVSRSYGSAISRHSKAAAAFSKM